MRRGSEIVFKVSDRGRGIPPEMIDRVFDRFETFPNGSRHRGPGLGLSIVRALVELHKGRVLIDTAPDEGTTVTCIFPSTLPRSRPGRRSRARGAGRAAIGAVPAMSDRVDERTAARRSGAWRRRTKRRRWRSPRRRRLGSSRATSSR